MEQNLQQRFLVDSSLGRLARWLRLMGFDACFIKQPWDLNRLSQILRQEQRIMLTRSRAMASGLPSPMVLCIQSELPQVQMNEVIHALDLHPEDLHPFTRCAVCNRALDRLPKSQAQGRIPDYVFQHQTNFKICPECRRIYWTGSHGRRWAAMMNQWFGQ